MRRILASPCVSPRRLPLSKSRRACISSISAPSNSHLYFKHRGCASNPLLAVNSGLSDIDNILSNGPANMPSNNFPDKEPSQNGKHLLQILRSNLTFTLSDPLTPLQQYQKLIDSGVLRGDAHQTRIIQKLQDLHDELVNYDPPIIPYSSSENSLVSLLNLFSAKLNPSSCPASS